MRTELAGVRQFIEEYPFILKELRSRIEDQKKIVQQCAISINEHEIHESAVKDYFNLVGYLIYSIKEGHNVEHESFKDRLRAAEELAERANMMDDFSKFKKKFGI